MEKEIQEVISSLINSITIEEKEESNQILRNCSEKLKETNFNMNDPDEFNTIFMYPLKNALTTLIGELQNIDSENSNYKKVVFVFANYQYLSSHIMRLIKQKCGFSCISDRIRHIIKIYLKSLLETDFVEEDFSEDHFWIPKFGTCKEWIEFCDGLYSLYYGSTEKYLNAYKVLLESDVRKYKRIVYNWYFKHVNGNVYYFMETSGEKPVNPLEDKYNSIDGYYLISKRRLNGLNYDFYLEEGRVHPFRYKVPKEDVVDIWYETKELYI